MHRKRSPLSRHNLQRGSFELPDPDVRRSHLLESFDPRFRQRICNMASRAACFEDLAEAFPGMLFALATGYGSLEARRAAVAHIIAGSRLREAAEALGLPWWLRRLPPQAFTQRLAQVPDEITFSSRIINLLPSTPTLAAKWLDRVLLAYRSCHAEFALWVAKHDRFYTPLARDPALPYLAAWAWHAGRPDTLAGRLVRRRWTPTMSPRRAFDELAAWRKRLRLSLTLSSLSREPWLASGSALGYEFVELRTIDDFIAESEAMHNCLDAFADTLESGVCFVFSIREKGVPVADIEIGVHPQDPQVPAIVQLRGPRNRKAIPQIWRAAYTWLGEQAFRPAPAIFMNSTERRRAWRTLWKPYLATLPATDRTTFEKLAAELDRMGKRRLRRRASRMVAERREQV
jgi:hypothetical protein